MKRTAFYSWQSDLPNATNRSFIESALKEAAKEIASDDSVDIEPVIDRDTLGAAGAPDISTTIFAKITEADLFVADISFIGKSKKKYLSNPNVLVELGYALGVKGSKALVLVFNTNYGKVENLPFDLKMRRILTYSAAEDEVNRSTAKIGLVRDLKAALLTGFASVKIPVIETPIVDIIRQNPADKIIHLRKHLSTVLTELDSLQPTMHRDGGTVDDLIKAIASTEPIAVAFAEMTEAIALMNDVDSAKEVFQWFGKILEKYHPDSNASGQISNADGDFFKFIGNEFFTIFILPFFKEGKWDHLREILSGILKVAPRQYRTNPTKESWHELSDWMPSLSDESKRKGKISIHDDLLNARHSVGPLSKISPLRDYQDTDFFLFLHGPGTTQGDYGSHWYPRSVLLMRHTPEFVLEAKDYPHAMRICHVLQIGDTEELKRRLTSSQRTIRYDWHSPISRQEIQAIGSEGGAKIIK